MNIKVVMRKTILIVALVIMILTLLVRGFFVVRQDTTIPSINNTWTGASGEVEYGIGDCMPCACNGEDCSDCPSKNYVPFNGEIFFIEKNKLDSLGNGNFTTLLESSAKTTVANGNYQIYLYPGEYVVMPKEVYQYGGNFVNISSRKVVEQNFKFFKCTSY